MIPRYCYPDLVPASTVISTRDRASGVDGNVSGFELDVINRLVKHNNPRVILEIGTFDGRTTLNMAAHAAPDATVYTLDLPPSGLDITALRIDDGDRVFIDKPASGARYVGTDVARKIIQLYGDSATFDFSPFFGTVDFMFVDGSHSYDYVTKDSLTALKLIKPNGIILWHDYVAAGPSPWPGLTKALNDLYFADHRFRNMRHIAGTAIVMLAITNEGGAQPTNSATAMSLFKDSTQPEYLRSSLYVDMEETMVQAGTPLRIHANAVNTGTATWMSSHVDTGPVRLGSRLLDISGNWLSESFSRSYFPENKPVARGESVRFDGEIDSPPPGKYIIEFELVADGVAWFSRNGVSAVRIPVEVQ